MLRKLPAFMLIIATTMVVVAQEEEPVKTPKPKPPAEIPNDTDTTLTTAPIQQSAFVIICDSSPNQIIVLDSSGQWVPNVRAASLTIEIGMPSKISCMIWSGPFKPTSPEVRTWTLSQMKSVSATQFQQYIDSLQTDPQAIAKALGSE